MKDFFKKRPQLKKIYEKAEILAIEDDCKKQEELDKLSVIGTTIRCHTIVKRHWP